MPWDFIALQRSLKITTSDRRSAHFGWSSREPGLSWRRSPHGNKTCEIDLASGSPWSSSYNPISESRFVPPGRSPGYVDIPTKCWMISWPSMNGCIHSAFLLARPQHCRLLHNSAAPVEKETVVRQSQPRYLASTLWYFSPLANDDGICRTRAILRRRPDRLARHPTWSGGTYKCPSIFISFVCFSPSWHYVTTLSND
jgi:hypothetical protein